MLDICTFTPNGGGNIFYKAIAHPLAASALQAMRKALPDDARLAVYDPDDVANTFLALYPEFRPQEGVFTQASEQVERDDRLGGQKKPLADLGKSAATHIVALSFEDAKTRAQLGRVINPKQHVLTLAPARLPDEMLSNKRHYLDKLNFATNFCFFRDDEKLSTRLVTVNYWDNYGAKNVRYWFRLYDASGASLVEWVQPVGATPEGVIIDSRVIRERFKLPTFCGQLFVHVLGAKGHDVVKYALDIYGHDGDVSLSVTHDANAWPSPRFASLPAPDAGECVVVWVQNSHATPIPPHEISLNVMGGTQHYIVDAEIPGFGTYRLDVAQHVPGIQWPAQLELRTGNHIVRPRYEVTQNALTRIAHLNVERQDLKPDPAIRQMPEWMGRGFIMPFPILAPDTFTTIMQPNPMSELLIHMPLRVDVFDKAGALVTQKFLGNLPRDHQCALAVHELTSVEGHGELVYDFREGGDADGWLHAMMRYRHRKTLHAAETSFGGHIFNTLMTWRNEPQSYAGPPPGLTTRLFLKLGQNGARSFSHLIYPTSVAGQAPSETKLHLISKDGAIIAEKSIQIPASGSFVLWPDTVFGVDQIVQAGEGGYVLIRDLSCRLFGYHGQENAAKGFSLDHMFGF